MENQEKYLVIGGDGVLGQAMRSISVNFNATFVFTSRLITGLPLNTVHLDLATNFTEFRFSEYSAVIYLAQSREYRNLLQWLLLKSCMNWALSSFIVLREVFMSHASHLSQKKTH
jgi:hypothetical protein